MSPPLFPSLFLLFPQSSAQLRDEVRVSVCLSLAKHLSIVSEFLAEVELRKQYRIERSAFRGAVAAASAAAALAASAAAGAGAGAGAGASAGPPSRRRNAGGIPHRFQKLPAARWRASVFASASLLPPVYALEVRDAPTLVKLRHHAGGQTTVRVAAPAEEDDEASGLIARAGGQPGQAASSLPPSSLLSSAGPAGRSLVSAGLPVNRDRARSSFAGTSAGGAAGGGRMRLGFDTLSAVFRPPITGSIMANGVRILSSTVCASLVRLIVIHWRLCLFECWMSYSYCYSILNTSHPTSDGGVAPQHRRARRGARGRTTQSGP